jgi:hypothetical protein
MEAPRESRDEFGHHDVVRTEDGVQFFLPADGAVVHKFRDWDVVGD